MKRWYTPQSFTLLLHPQGEQCDNTSTSSYADESVYLDKRELLYTNIPLIHPIPIVMKHLYNPKVTFRKPFDTNNNSKDPKSIQHKFMIEMSQP